MEHCKYCGALMMVGTCPVCHRNSAVQPPQLMSARLFDLNPHLRKRLEWHAQIRKNMLMPDLPFDPTKLHKEDLPPKVLPTYRDFPRADEKKKKKDLETLQA